MPREYCSNCRKVTDTVVTVSERDEQQPDGSVRRVRTESVHCEPCGAFIRSRDLEDD